MLFACRYLPLLINKCLCSLSVISLAVLVLDFDFIRVVRGCSKLFKNWLPEKTFYKRMGLEENFFRGEKGLIQWYLAPVTADRG